MYLLAPLINPIQPNQIAKDFFEQCLAKLSFYELWKIFILPTNEKAETSLQHAITLSGYDVMDHSPSTPSLSFLSNQTTDQPTEIEKEKGRKFKD